MNTLHVASKYTEWLCPEEMHENTKAWLSELEFIRDEHLFFNDLINCTSLDILPNTLCDKFEIKHAINKSEKHANMLIGMTKNHDGKIEIVLDGLDQLKEEKLFKYEHRLLLNAINSYKKNFNRLKTQLFNIVKRVKREEQIRSIINKRKDYLNPVLN